MRHIQKRPQPAWFREFRSQNSGLNWNSFTKYHDQKKLMLKRELLDEQQYLCGYCGKLLDEYDSHIEHVIPRSEVRRYGKSDLTFDNLLVSCPEDSYEEGVNTCGHAKGAWYDPSLFVSPYDQDCESYFTYSELGQIMPPTNDPQVQEYRKSTTTIARLALDTYELSEARRGMIEGLLGEEPWSLSQGELCQLLEVVQTPDHEGRLRPYCFAIKHVIEQYLQSQTC